MELLALAIIALAAIIFFKGKMPANKTTNAAGSLPTEGFPPDDDTKDNHLDYSRKYRKKYILTLNEKQQYYTIKSVADELGLHVFAKVRLLDIIEPIPGIDKWKTYFYKIQAKHVDFLICKPNVTTLCTIEIDDNSHNAAKRQERDTFVDFILKDCKVPVIRSRSIVQDELRATLQSMLDPQPTNVN